MENSYATAQPLDNVKLTAPKKQRIWELDFLRGICVLLMIFDHVMYDLAYVFGPAWAATGSDFLAQLWAHSKAYFETNLRDFVQPLVVIIFAFLCGISCSFSRNNLKRGLQVGICAALITLVTTLMDMPIRFGILHMFCVAILLWWLINLCCRNKKWLTAGVCLAVGVTIVLINYFLMQEYNAFNLANPRNLGEKFVDTNTWAWVGEFLYGNPYAEFSADYQPIFPTVGYMLIGSSLAPLLYAKKRSLLPWLGKYDWYKPFSLWGKIALPVYVLHQVVVAVILALISFFFITKGNWVII
ncbi:MAG: heparan-alpha-glucosaminide N-acetyltransferase domain-containing protein [Clostridia bacterium]